MSVSMPGFQLHLAPRSVDGVWHLRRTRGDQVAAAVVRVNPFTDQTSWAKRLVQIYASTSDNLVLPHANIC